VTVWLSEADRRFVLAIFFGALAGLFYWLGNVPAGTGFLGAASGLAGAYGERIRRP